MRPKILMADDESYILEGAVMALKNEFEITTATSVTSAKTILSRSDTELAIVDLNFEGQDEDGIHLIDFLNKKDPTIPIVVLSSDKNTQRVVSAMRRDLVCFIVKKGDYRDDLRIAIRNGLEQRKQKLELNSSQIFLTKSSKMKSLLQKVDKITSNSNDCSILIIGETGTGKEVLTRYIANRLKKKIVAANMASIPRETAESELFGHMAGAFTGAIKNKIGLIEQANDGIFFLDELGECSLDIQAKLLRALEQREIRPVGSTQTRNVNVQFIGATNKNLHKMMANGLFREDLYQRLNTFVLEIPPLRDRPEDVILYATKFIAEFTQDQSFYIESEILDILRDHTWPGNVRELKNTIERIVTLSSHRTIDRNTVEESIGRQDIQNTKTCDLKYSRRETLKISAILKALEMEDNNRTKAAEFMGVHRSTFLRWINQFGIDDILKNPLLLQTFLSQRSGV